MENTIPVVRFVRCPKCHKILTEFSEIPVYKCGGCGAILRAKVRSNSGQNLSSVLAIPASQDNDPLSNGSKILRQKIPDSDVATVVEQAEIKNLNVSDSIGGSICKEKSLGHEQNENKNLIVSDLNVDVNEAKTEPLGLEGTSIRKRLEEGNEELEKSPSVRSEVYDSQKSSDKLEESSESMGHCSTSDEDKMNMEFGDDTRFRMTARSSSQAYEGSVSSTDGDRKNNNFRLSRRTFRNKNMSNSTNITDAEENSARRFSDDRLRSATNGKLSSIHYGQNIDQDPFFTSQAVRQKWIESENHSSSSSPAMDVKVKILSRVDELRNELTGFLNETDNSKDSSLFGVKISQFQGKVPSKEYRSSLIPLSRKPSSSYIHNHSGETCCHNEHCRPCPHNVCCHLSEPTILPPHMQNRTINQEPQNLQFKAPRPQNIIRLCRPVSGGAPFVMCYKCFKLLQLPTDFLVSPKRVNKLRCGACSQVLMYFFRPRSSSMPLTPIENQHPPSEENDELSVVAVDENLVSRHEDITAWDPISTSESTFSEVEPALHKSRSFDERVEEEQGEEGCLKGLRLHNLMGYSSASEILFHNGYSHDGYQSTETLKI
ncbi:hypothetical protein M5K25_019671 [Dendrobium thyrsiflorum]|uniref:Zinc-ribbon domain-containing protein n=1 Tax=Dendrobium thyrsiflorum TaxID=117978 RepID=A0ABD0UFJ5_DENTH